MAALDVMRGRLSALGWGRGQGRGLGPGGGAGVAQEAGLDVVEGHADGAEDHGLVAEGRHRHPGRGVDEVREQPPRMRSRNRSPSSATAPEMTTSSGLSIPARAATARAIRSATRSTIPRATSSPARAASRTVAVRPGRVPAGQGPQQPAGAARRALLTQVGNGLGAEGPDQVGDAVGAADPLDQLEEAQLAGAAAWPRTGRPPRNRPEPSRSSATMTTRSSTPAATPRQRSPQAARLASFSSSTGQP